MISDHKYSSRGIFSARNINIPSDLKTTVGEEPVYEVAVRTCTCFLSSNWIKLLSFCLVVNLQQNGETTEERY